MFVCIEHLLEREVGFDVRTAVGARDIVEVIDERGGMSGFTFLDEKAGFSVTDDLLRGTTPEGNDGCAGGHGLDGGQAKGLVPFDGEKQAKRLTHDFPQSQPFQLSKIGHAPSGSPQFRYDALLKIVTVVMPPAIKRRYPAFSANSMAAFAPFSGAMGPGKGS